jgi:uncharacterized membrane protein YphA (DoxX/SURF4 family)
MRLPGTILQGILARAALTFLRVFLGGVFLLSAWAGFRNSYPGGPAADWILWAELLVGCALVLGLLTRLAAAGALVIVVYPLLAEPPELGILTRREIAWACISIALLMGAAGRTFGLDAFLAKRWIRSPLW